MDPTYLPAAELCVAGFVELSFLDEPGLLLQARTVYHDKDRTKPLANSPGGQAGHFGGGRKGDAESPRDAMEREFEEEISQKFEHPLDLRDHGYFEQLQPAKFKYAQVYTTPGIRAETMHFLMKAASFKLSDFKEGAGVIVARPYDIIHRCARGGVRLATLGLMAAVPYLRERWLPDDDGIRRQIEDALSSWEDGISRRNVDGLIGLFGVQGVQLPWT